MCDAVVDLLTTHPVMTAPSPQRAAITAELADRAEDER
jgi:hypothetical protein